jgi:hypothetical protein
MLAGSAMALLCAAGHALAGRGMFCRPIRSTIANNLHGGVFTGMWHLMRRLLGVKRLFVLEGAMHDSCSRRNALPVGRGLERLFYTTKS